MGRPHEWATSTRRSDSPTTRACRGMHTRGTFTKHTRTACRTISLMRGSTRSSAFSTYTPTFNPSSPTGAMLTGALGCSCPRSASAARGLRVWNTRHTSNRAFILREPEKSIAQEGVCEVYREAMRHAGLNPLAAPTVDLSVPLTGSELRAAARGDLLPLVPGAVEAEARIREYVQALPSQRCQRLLVELLSRDLMP
jgi:hypothetical protein